MGCVLKITSVPRGITPGSILLQACIMGKKLADFWEGKEPCWKLMGCEEICPAIPAKKIIEWDIPDPKGKPIQVFREVRDLVEGRVRSLLKEID